MLAYVGGYSSADRDGRAPGITVHRVGAPGEPWTLLQTLATPEDNPSLLHLGPDGTRLYAVHGARTAVSAHAVGADGLLSPLNQVGGLGENPVDLGVWPGTRCLAVASYTGGTVALLDLAADGALLPPTALLALERPDHPGPSLPHGVTFDPSGRFLLVPDKGLDRVWVFTRGPGGALVPAGSGVSEPGSGPRHCAFHPSLPVLYVVNELACSVGCFAWSADGALRPVQTVPTLPDGAAPGLAAEIAVAPDGRSLYASTRGRDVITRFAVDPATGRLGAATVTPCGGAEPRFFALSPDARILHVASQGSHRIVSFPLDEAGRLGAGTVSAEVGSPTAICFGAAP